MIPPDSFLSLCSSFYSHAQTHYPHEVCGVWVEFPDGRQQWHLLNNAAEHPERQFWLDTREWLQILEEARSGKWRLLGVGHSHPDSPPLLSAEDRRWLEWDGRPVYPTLQWLIVSVGQGGGAAACFAWDESSSGWACVWRGQVE